MEISVLFFGVLGDITGTCMKHYRGISSFSHLRHRVEDEYPEFVHYTFRIAVNNKIMNDEHPLLRDGDVVAFLPPFAGG